ncbi:GerAB/ArcD/ProY family transporter [Peribacillus glennii]|uniref:Spore gernimation protein GerB n=1 Tax=Peribacillus glennii TaxID=2303991 RepID=A0A372LCX1_9BACI|nr:GerAB/ArcD/ProY family transporter [Peribacillus glennii]RFU63827.1 spore gernimation protein GerB [Peribacillus glennii]
MDIQPKENRKVSAYYAMFLIHKMQLGVGILGFERVIAKYAEYDAWISIIIGGLSVHVILWLSFRILHKDGNDIVSIHQFTFGKWIGGVVTVFFILYILLITVTILRTYIEVIQVWMFPGLNAYVLMIVLGLLVYSFVIGGFRVIAGAAFMGILITLPLLLLKYFPLQQAHFSNLAPVFNHSIKDILLSAKTMTLNYIGFELVFMFYPFLNQPRKAEKWAHFGHAFSIFIYLVSALVSFVYFSQDQLKHSVWATLTLWKIVDLPFVERFEYVGISMWLFGVIPNICLGLWAASRAVKRLFYFEQRKSLIYLLAIVLMCSMYFETRQQVDLINTILSRMGFWIMYFYIPILFVLYTVVHKVRKKTP